MGDSMMDPNQVPYFPLKLLADREGYTFINPVADTRHSVSQSAGRVLSLCNGERRWCEIVKEICRSSGAGKIQVAKAVYPFLRDLTNEGAVWWRAQPMTWSIPDPPISVFWNITGRCNLACRHCAVSSGIRHARGLRLTECRRIIDDMVAFGTREVALSGGEPLCRPDWFELAAYARSYGLTVSVSTNGTLVNKKAARQIAELEADVQVSLDGATPAAHDAFRRIHGAWARAVRGVRHFVAAGVPVTIGATVTTINIQQIPALCDLARDLGAQTLRIIPFVPFGRGGGSQKLEVSPLAMRQLTEFLRERRRLNDIDITELEFECVFDPPPRQLADLRSQIGCAGARSYITITENGEVLPCHFFSGVEAGNVLDHKLAWIWEHSRFLNYFRSIEIADLSGACRRCDWLPLCLGSCRAANFAHRHLFCGNNHCWLDTAAVRRARVRHQVR